MNLLKEKFREKSSLLRDEMRAFSKENGSKVIDQVQIQQIFGGMRGVKSLIWETSQLDAIDGIRFRGYSIPQLRNILPKGARDNEPLPEGLFWLMLVGEVPSQTEVEWLCDDWEKRAKVPDHTYKVIESLPVETHPMTQFITAIASMQSESIFAKKYNEGIHKNEYWDYTFEDCMNLIAKLPPVAAYIYRRSFKNGDHIKADKNLDWAGNFAHMLGMEEFDFRSLMRLYMVIHADHEGGNASAHTTHLIGSTLSDAYLSLAGGMSSLAGPLHGLANQEVVRFINHMVDDLGTDTPSKSQIKHFVKKTLNEGKVIPGYGHAVLRRPDPRFVALKEFAGNNIKESKMVNIVWNLFEVVPPVLESLGKVKNPWPNVDAHSGALLVHYGMTEYNFYTVLFGVSRALGVLSSLCWSRALGFSLERPKSVTFDWLKSQIVKEN